MEFHYAYILLNCHLLFIMSTYSVVHSKRSKDTPIIFVGDHIRISSMHPLIFTTF